MTDQQRAAMQAALQLCENLHGAELRSGLKIRTEPTAKQLRAALAEPEVERAEIGPEWTPCVKRPVTVHVRGQRPGEAHVSTREGLTPVKPDDLIMRGVDGEEYPIGRDLFNRTYLVGVARIKQQEAEPVAWGMRHSDGRIYDCIAPGEHDREPGQYTVPLYTAPPRREWVGLTEQEIWDSVKHGVVGGIGMPSKAVAVARAIEAALKERNK